MGHARARSSLNKRGTLLKTTKKLFQSPIAGEHGVINASPRENLLYAQRNCRASQQPDRDGGAEIRYTGDVLQHP